MTTDEFADEIVGRCRERMERGETVDPEEVIRAHPELSAKLRERFAALALLDAALATSADPGPATSLEGRRIGGYRLETLLGAGGMGSVWLASGDGGERVAVKVVHPHLERRGSGPGRFEREAALGLRVRHANVVRTLGAGEHAEDGTTLRYLVMEHVEGRTLREMLDEDGRLPEELCRHVGREVARGLAAIHAERAVHRDLKPDNVIVTRDHEVKVMDLGVVRLEDAMQRLSRTGDFVGSLNYAAPEQLTAAAIVDARADLHALGVLLYEMATGVHPFAGGEVLSIVRRVLDESPRRAGAVNPQLSPFLEELVTQLLEKDREKRPPGAAEVAAILAEGEGSAWWRERARAIRAATHRPLRRIRIARETEVYGRDTELALLRSLYDRAAAGDGQAVLAVGEAGIGKSRLVDEFVARLVAEGEDVEFLFGSWPPGGAATGAGALAAAIRERFGDEGLEDALRERLGDARVLAPAFAARLAALPPPEGAAPLTRDALATCFVHVARSLASERTTIVLADDLHFAPEEGRALFASLARAAPGHRLLVLGTARPEVGELWVDQLVRGGATHLPLARLGAKDLVALLVDALRSRSLAERLGVKIAEKSDGNPFFVFELLRGLREGRYITRTPEGTWVTSREIRDLEVPPSVVEVVQARLSELDAADRDALEVAACLGFEFDASLVGEVVGVAPIPLLQRLGAIERRRRLVRSVGPRFVFDHHQVQEVLYAGLSDPLREAYHAGIARALEARHGAASIADEDLDGAVCVELADHFLRGAAGARALRYLERGVAHLKRDFLADAVIRLVDRALAAPGLLTGAARCRALLSKLDALDVLGRREEQAASASEAMTLAGSDERLLATALLGWARYCVVTTRLNDACDALSEAVSLHRKLGDSVGASKAMSSLSEALRGLGRLAEAVPLAEEALAAARRSGDGRAVRNAIESLAITYYEGGRNEEARVLFEEVRELHRANGDRRSEGMATQFLGGVVGSYGLYDEAIACHELGIAVAREFGDRFGEANSVGNLANILAELGRHDESRVLLERQLALSREVGSRRGEAAALVNLGYAWFMLGRMARAKESLEASLALCREVGTRYPEGFALQRLGDVAAESGDEDAARRYWEDALALRRSVGHGDGVAESLLTLGDMRCRAGDVEGARAAVDEALALAQEHGFAMGLPLALAMLAKLPGGDAAAAVAAVEATPTVDTATVRWLLWEATGDTAHLAAARRFVERDVALAPPEHQESIRRNIRLHREILETAEAHGV